MRVGSQKFESALDASVVLADLSGVVDGYVVAAEDQGDLLEVGTEILDSLDDHDCF